MSFFGTTPGAAGRNGSRGMRRNPEARRHVRLFVLEAGPGARGGLVPAAVLQLGANLARDFSTDVAISNRYVRVTAGGDVRADGRPGWVLFSPRLAAPDGGPP